jgi:hypothetical protein
LGSAYPVLQAHPSLLPLHSLASYSPLSFTHDQAHAIIYAAGISRPCTRRLFDISSL